MKQDEPINVDELLKNAYESAYDNPIQLDADGGVHTDSMPRVRAFAGNEDRGWGTYTESVEVEIEVSVGGREGYNEVQETESQMLVDDVARAMVVGTRDKIEGNSKDPERAI